MRANCSATSEKIVIFLKKDNISSLEKAILKGFIAMPSEKGNIVRPLNIYLGEINHDRGFNFVEIKHDPENADYTNAKSFNIILSKEAYIQLIQTGCTLDRGYHGCKVIINLK